MPFKKLRMRAIFEAFLDRNEVKLKWSTMTQGTFDDLLCLLHWWTLQHGKTSEELLAKAPKNLDPKTFERKGG